MKRRIGIKGNVVFFFFLFVFLVIGLLWVFQFIFFDDIYRETQIRALQKSADDISKMQDTDYEQFVRDVAGNKSQCVLIYDSNMKLLAGEHSAGQCVVHNLSQSTIKSLYARTKEYENFFFETYLTADDMDLILAAKNADEKFPFFPYRPDDEPLAMGAYDCMFICQVILNKQGEERFVLQSVAIIPLESTVDALRFEMLVVSITLIAVSVVLSYFLTDILSKPIIQLNRASKFLPSGKFSSEGIAGYLEVEELCDTLSRASDEISKTDRLRRELIANVSHDLRTPLTLISGYSEAMRDLPGENTPENLQIIIDEANRLSNLVTDLMDLSKLEANVENTLFEPIDLVSYTKSIIERFIKMLEKDGYKFLFQTNLDHASVMVDPTQIGQVIYNLVNNAVNHCGKDKTIIINVFGNDSFVRLEIIDHGAGIPEEKLPEIWDRYFRLDSHHKSAKIGSGLGLSIVKKILEIHRVDFGVSSKVGEGSCFWFSFPVIRG